MREKRLALGICDCCGSPFPTGVSLYTRRGPRLYCSIDCRNTANSRAGAPIRAEKARRRVERGEWLNPSPALRDDATPEELTAWHEAVSRGLSAERVAEVEAGTWRNPALDAAAREKLSTPRRHDGILADAIEKLGRGARVRDLTPEEQQAHRSYRRELAASHHNDPATPNDRLRSARQSAGLSQQALAAAIGVSHTTVSQWERQGMRPRDPDVRRAIEELLGTANLWP